MEVSVSPGGKSGNVGANSSLDPRFPKYTSQLLERDEIDEIDDLDLKLSNAFKALQEIISQASEKEINNILVDKVSENMEQHSTITMGLLFGILTDPSQASSYFQYLHFVVRDNFLYCLNILKTLSLDKYPRLQQNCRAQLLWFVEKLVELNIHEIDKVCVHLLRQIVGGDISQKNLWLINNMLRLFEDHRDWLNAHPLLIPVVVYTFLRLIIDHTRSAHESIRLKEISLVTSLLTTKFPECCVIGRDLVRLLQDVSKIPEFEEIWKNLISNPSNFNNSPNFNGISTLLNTRTPRVYILSRLSHEMETWLMFLLTQVKMGNQRRYQLWFAQKFLNTPESESLVCDLIRFICCCYHPSNQALNSDIIPRWAVIGWLLKCVKTSYMAANAKLALFYDWLFFDPKLDNIMNIEPAMLLMMHSIPKYAGLTATLVEFLVSVMEVYDPTRKDMIKKGVFNSLGIMLKKGVVSSLAPLFSCPHFDPSLAEKMKTSFAPFYKELEERGEIKKERSEITMTDASKGMLLEDAKKPSEIIGLSFSQDSMTETPLEEEAEETFTEEEMISEETTETIEEMETEEEVELPEAFVEFAPLLTQLYHDQTIDSLLPILIKIVEKFGTSSVEIIKDFAPFFVRSLQPSMDFTSSTLFSKESLINFMFSYYQNKPTPIILSLFHHMQETEPSVGLRILTFCISNAYLKKEQLQEAITRNADMQEIEKLYSEIPTPQATFYHLYSDTFSDVSKDKSIHRDLKVACDNNVALFFRMVPFVFRLIPEFTVGNSSIIYLIVSNIDSSEIRSLSDELILSEFVMFGQKNIQSLIESSLNWESLEQISFWQLLSVEISKKPQMIEECVMPVFKSINPSFHGEALNGMLVLFKDVTKPTRRMAHAIISLPMSFHYFVRSVLCQWHKLRTEPFYHAIYQAMDILQKESHERRDLAKLFLKHLSLWRRVHPNHPFWSNSHLQFCLGKFMEHLEMKDEFGAYLRFDKPNQPHGTNPQVTPEEIDLESDKQQPQRKRLRKVTPNGQ